MDGALGWHPDLAIEAPDQELADLAGTPVRLFGFEPDNQPLELVRQLVGVAHRSARSIAQGRQPVLLVAIEYLVASLPRDPKISTYVRHRLTVQKAGDKPQALLHHRTRFPRHQHLPPKAKSVTHVSGTKCHLCLGPPKSGVLRRPPPASELPFNLN